MSSDATGASLTPDLTGIFHEISFIAQLKLEPVMLMGETGVGKTHIAQVIHSHPNSRRRDGPFVALNMAEIKPELAESLLFGHMKGAYTGAHANHDGAFEQARGGTLFLDEVAELSLEVQAKLLRALSEKKIRPIGAKQEIDTDVRIITATSQGLAGAVQERRFREDLFYRLNGLEVRILPLRERPNDLINLASHFAAQKAEENEVPHRPFTEEALAHLQQGAWPGNIRQLQHVVTRGILHAMRTDSNVIDVGHIRGEFEVAAAAAGASPAQPQQVVEPDEDNKTPEWFREKFLEIPTYEQIKQVHRDAWFRMLQRTLVDNDYNSERAGEILGVLPNAVRNAVKKEFNLTSTAALKISEAFAEWEPEQSEFGELVTALAASCTTKDDLDHKVDEGRRMITEHALRHSPSLNKAAIRLGIKSDSLNYQLDKWRINAADYLGSGAADEQDPVPEPGN